MAALAVTGDVVTRRGGSARSWRLPAWFMDGFIRLIKDASIMRRCLRHYAIVGDTAAVFCLIACRHCSLSPFSRAQPVQRQPIGFGRLNMPPARRPRGRAIFGLRLSVVNRQPPNW